MRGVDYYYYYLTKKIKETRRKRGDGLLRWLMQSSTMGKYVLGEGRVAAVYVPTNGDSCSQAWKEVSKAQRPEFRVSKRKVIYMQILARCGGTTNWYIKGSRRTFLWIATGNASNSSRVNVIA